MQKIKCKYVHIGICFLAIVMAMMSLLCENVSAQETKDDISVNIVTDKDSYSANQDIDISLGIQNNTDKVFKVNGMIYLPENMKLSGKSNIISEFNLQPNEKNNLSYQAEIENSIINVGSKDDNNSTNTPIKNGNNIVTNPLTGLESVILNIILCAIILIVCASVIFKTKKKKIKICGLFFAVLCAVLCTCTFINPVSAEESKASQSITTIKKITVDGKTEEIKVVLNYKEEQPDETIPFKTAGKNLYKLKAEKNSYSSAEVTINGTAMTANYREKLNASYIDMLFGTNNKQGEFTTAITSDSADKTLIVGLTDDEASYKALSMINKDEWIICNIDDKIVVTGWFDNATAQAARKLYNLAAASNDVRLSLPIKGTVSGYNTDIPLCESGKFKGGIDGEDGTLVFRYASVDKDDFNTYSQKLISSGYTLYQENNIKNYKDSDNMFKTFIKGDKMVHLSYLPADLLSADKSDMSTDLKYYAEHSFRPDGNEMRIITDYSKYSITSNTDNSYNDDGITPKLSTLNLYNKSANGSDNGQCQIFTLADGSFIVYDGGITSDATQVYNALVQLNERKDNKIVIAAWVLTHAHPDHVGVFEELTKHDLSNNIVVQKVICNNVASTYNWRSQNDPYGYTIGLEKTLSESVLRSYLDKYKNGTDAQIIHPHMGQKMYVKNAEIEILFSGDEDLYPVLMNNDNDSSMVSTVTIGGQKTLMMGDSAADTAFCTLMPLYSQVLESDILQVAHHGFGGEADNFYKLVKPTVAIWSTTKRSIDKYNLFNTPTNAGINTSKLKLNIVADDYLQTINLPYNNEAVVKRVVGKYLSSTAPAELKVSAFGAGTLGRMDQGFVNRAMQLIKDSDSDVIAVTAVEQNTDLCSNVDMAKLIADECGYPYYYYAAAWNRDQGDLTTSDDGTHGNMILSRYPIKSNEKHIILEGGNGEGPEGRSTGHSVITIEGTDVDFYYTEFGNANDWNKFSDVFKPENDNYVILGTVRSNNIDEIRNYLNDDEAQIAITENDGRDTIIVSGDITLSDPEYISGSDVNGSLSPAFMDAFVSAKIAVPRISSSQGATESTILEWGCNRFADSSQIKQETIDNIKVKNADMASIIAFEGYEQDIEQFATDCGYQYYYFVNGQTKESGKLHGNLLLSKFDFVNKEKVQIVEDQASPKYDIDLEGRCVGHVTVKIKNKNVDVYFGEISYQYEKQAAWDKLENKVKSVKSSTGNEFMVFGALYNTELGTTFADTTFDTVASGYDHNIIVSDGIGLSEKSRTTPILSPFYDDMLTAKYNIK